MARSCAKSGCNEPRCNRSGLCREHYNEKRKRTGSSQKSNLKGLSIWIKRWLNAQPCVMCGWARAGCDVHHIEPFDKDNPEHSNRISNLLPLCPNHHREQQVGLLDDHFLKILNREWLKTVPKTWPACQTCTFKAESWQGQANHNAACARNGGVPSTKTLKRRKRR